MATMRSCFALAMLAAAARAAKPTLEEVRADLESTKTECLNRISAAGVELHEAFSGFKVEQKAAVSAMDLNSNLESLWQTTSGLYDSLAAKDPVVYEEILDKYFSSDEDLYIFLESKISPWYDVFDAEQVWDYEFYSLVDSYDILYSTVDEANDRLYAMADTKFEALYDMLEDLSVELDLIADGESDTQNRSASALQDGEYQFAERSATAYAAHVQRHNEEVAQTFEQSREVAERVAKARADAQQALANNGGLPPAAQGPLTPAVVAAVAGASGFVAILSMSVSFLLYRRANQALERSEANKDSLTV